MTTFAGGSELRFLILYTLFAVSCSIIAGTIIYYLIERPFIRWGKRVAARV
ncbi:MAG: hypothetical protein K9I85_12975 [Saprospiraceae bacterium]|nr:hypothetical protein [Saprospiraceae bacterium]